MVRTRRFDRGALRRDTIEGERTDCAAKQISDRGYAVGKS
jgi:hypothetical protein